MTYRDVLLSIEGLRDRDKFHHDLLRRSTMIIACSGLGGKEIARKFDQLWPASNNKDRSSMREKALEQLRYFKEQEQLKGDQKKVKDIIDGRRP